MMNCPECGTANSPGTRYCVNCGSGLLSTLSGKMMHGSERGSRSLLAVATARFLVSLLLLWFFRSVFLQLSFVRETIIPSFPLTVAQVVQVITNLVTLALAISFSVALRELWAKAFPSLAPLGSILVTLVYVLILVVAYSAIRVPASALIEGLEWLLVLRISFVVMAAVMMGSAWNSFYQILPDWLGSMRFAAQPSQLGEIACLTCGFVNRSSAEHCSRCGSSLESKSEEFQD